MSCTDYGETFSVLLCDWISLCKESALQVVGVSFLMLLKQQGIPGSILADEMGLGKTAQAICFLGMFVLLAKCDVSAWSTCRKLWQCATASVRSQKPIAPWQADHGSFQASHARDNL